MALEFTHTCIDLETLSTQSDAVIVTIAAVKFRFDTDETEKFCVNVNPREGKELGLHISKDTLDWWRLQNPEAVKAWQHSQIGLSDALDQFLEFVPSSKTMKFYCQGTNFDFPVMESSFRVTGKREPWKFYNLVDIRTICWLASFDYKNAPRVGEYHNALDDCMTQISWIKQIIKGQN